MRRLVLGFVAALAFVVASGAEAQTMRIPKDGEPALALALGDIGDFELDVQQEVGELLLADDIAFLGDHSALDHAPVRIGGGAKLAPVRCHFLWFARAAVFFAQVNKLRWIPAFG